MKSSGVMAGRRGIVLGVANRRSIAWGIAHSLVESGSTLGLTYQGQRLHDRVAPLAEELGSDFLVPCDVCDENQVKELFDHVKKQWGTLDFLVHSIAFARREDLEGAFTSTSRAGFLEAHEISSYSLTALCHGAADLMAEGGAVVALTYLGGERVVPGYNVMGVAKASLEMNVRYLAADLGPRGIRVNAISSGPVNTVAARGVAGFTKMLEIVREKSPLGRNVSLEELGAAATFLLSPLSSGITGEVIHVDAGFHILGM